MQQAHSNTARILRQPYFLSQLRRSTQTHSRNRDYIHVTHVTRRIVLRRQGMLVGGGSFHLTSCPKQTSAARSRLIDGQNVFPMIVIAFEALNKACAVSMRRNQETFGAEFATHLLELQGAQHMEYIRCQELIGERPFCGATLMGERPAGLRQNPNSACLNGLDWEVSWSFCRSLGGPGKDASEGEQV